MCLCIRIYMYIILATDCRRLGIKKYDVKLQKSAQNRVVFDPSTTATSCQDALFFPAMIYI